MGCGLTGSNLDSCKHGNLVYLFTGQGAQYVNMGRDLYNTQPLFRDIINECAKILNEFMEIPLLDVLYPASGKASPLDQTQYTQPALFTLEYALAKLWESWGVKPQIVIGHSVGEYVAACVAGVFSLKDGLKLIAHRARLMGALHEGGGMWAVFTDEETVARALAAYADKVAIAAVNGPKLVVVSGSSNCLQKVIDDLNAKGVPSTQLNVSHAFHSPLMEPMLNEFKQIAREISFSTPTIPVISNVSGSLAGSEITDPDYWVKHVVSPVRFASGMETLFRSGYGMFLEMGPKPVLTGMGRRLQNAKDSIWMHSLNDQLVDSGQMFLSVANLYVKGVDINWQNFHSNCKQKPVDLPSYPFQRSRYWLDSPSSFNRYEKLLSQDDTSRTVQMLERSGNFTDEELQLAPGLLKALAAYSTNNEASNIKRENIYNVEWKSVVLQKLVLSSTQISCESGTNDKKVIRDSSAESKLEMNSRIDGEKWLIFSGEGESGEKLAFMLRGLGAICVLVSQGESYEKVGDDKFIIDSANPLDFKRLMNDAEVTSGLNGIIQLCGHEIDVSENVAAEIVEDESALLCMMALYTVQALDALNIGSTNFWLITQGAQYDINSISGVAQSSIWGLGKVIMREHPKFNCRLVDIDPLDSEQGLQMLRDEILSVKTDNAEPFLSFRNGVRYVARFTQVIEPVNVADRVEISSKGSYLITGGLGGIGLNVASWLVKRGAKHLVLVGRTASVESSVGKIKEFEDKGCEIVVMHADVSIKNELMEVFNKIDASMPPLAGIFHCAGIFDDRLLVNHERMIFERVFSAKVNGAWNLHLLSKEKNLQIFVLFSSIFSVLPEPGLGNYAASNSFMDALVRYRKGMGLSGIEC